MRSVHVSRVSRLSRAARRHHTRGAHAAVERLEGRRLLSGVVTANFDAAGKPCEDFYQFANGAWLSANPIPADRSRYGSFDALADRNRDIVRKILEETSGKSDWAKGSPQQKVSDFYATGMDAAARVMAERGLPPPARGIRNTGEQAMLVGPDDAAGVYIGFVGLA